MQEWPAEKVERWPVERLIPYARNARAHSDAQVAQIAASIVEWGWTAPIFVDEAGLLIAGHGRVLASRKLGLTAVPVMVARGWSTTKKQAYILADNKIGLNAGWDAEMLKVELLDLKEMGADLHLVGFGQDEFAELLLPHAAGLIDPDKAPEPPTVPITRYGDTWTCGEHRILCGDATAMSAMEKLMAGEVASMVFTDPPYNVDYANKAKDKQRSTNRPILNDALGREFGAFLHDASVNILAVTRGAVYICM